MPCIQCNYYNPFNLYQRFIEPPCSPIISGYGEVLSIKTTRSVTNLLMQSDSPVFSHTFANKVDNFVIDCVILEVGLMAVKHGE